MQATKIPKRVRAEDFPKDVPADPNYDGSIDAFAMYGRFLLFFDMIHDAAIDLVTPADSQMHIEAMHWLNDPEQAEFWGQIVDLDPVTMKKINSAVIRNPVEISSVIKTIKNSSRAGGTDLQSLIDRLGAGRTWSASSIAEIDIDGYDAIENNSPSL